MCNCLLPALTSHQNPQHYLQWQIGQQFLQIDAKVLESLPTQRPFLYRLGSALHPLLLRQVHVIFPGSDRSCFSKLQLS